MGVKDIKYDIPMWHGGHGHGGHGHGGHGHGGHGHKIHSIVL